MNTKHKVVRALEQAIKNKRDQIKEHQDALRDPYIERMLLSELAGLNHALDIVLGVEL